MKLFSEWTNTRIKMSFQERYGMLLNRLSALSSMKSSADYSLNNKTGAAVNSCGCYNYYSNDKSVEELVQDVDLMWAELRKEIISSVKEKEKIEKEKKE